MLYARVVKRESLIERLSQHLDKHEARKQQRQSHVIPSITLSPKALCCFEQAGAAGEFGHLYAGFASIADISGRGRHEIAWSYDMI